MKTPIFEDYFFYLVKLPKFVSHLLIGSALCCIPIAHFFAFGYLYQITGALYKKQRLVLPEWTNWMQLFYDGLRFSVPWLFIWLCPVILASLIKYGLDAIGMSLFGTLTLICALLFANCTFAAALFLLHKNISVHTLANYRSMIQLCTQNGWRLALPSLIALTPLLALPQIYGFAYFLSTLLLLPYCILVWTLKSTK